MCADRALPRLNRWYPAVPFAVTGTACVVAGGLVAAVTAAAPTEHATWTAAYLVLVGGVAQIGLGAGQALLAPHVPSPRLVAADFALWNAGNAAVVAGTLVDAVRLVDVGGGLLVLALALIVGAVRGGSPRGRRQLYAFRLLVVVLLVSIPVGLLLARTAR